MKPKKQIPILNTEQSIVERFDIIAGTFGNKIAIKDGKNALTYRSLQEKANVIANQILSLGSDQKQIAIFLSYGANQLVSLLGIIKSGCAYVPIDTSWPAHRIEFAVTDSSAAAIITDNVNLGQIRSLSHDRVIINIDEIDFRQNTHQPEKYPVADDIIHILYTSGSTGEPKGVYTSHRNQMHFIKRFSEYIRISPDDIFSYYFSIGFSAHAMPSLGALLNGATLAIYNLKKFGFPGLSEFFIKESITVCLMIPSVMRHFRATLEKGFKLEKLRILMIAGESLYYNDILQIRPYLKSSTDIINMYASTEMFLACAFRMKKNTLPNQNIIPIGLPVEGIEIEIQNKDGIECEPNQIGEIIIYSRYAALGYWDKPELSDQDFPPQEDIRRFNSRDLAYRKSDGNIVHVGRGDSMVKIRGQRVDLSEIENCLLYMKDIQEVAAVLKEDPLGNKVITAYYVCRYNRKVEEKVLQTVFLRRLPDFMIPKFLIKLDSLPKTDSGKTDYLSMPDPDWKQISADKEIKHASNPIEDQLVLIFKKHFDVYQIGVQENILQAGHDSLKLFVAFDTIEKTFGIKFDLDSVLKTPTIEAMAVIIKNLQEGKDDH
ncbi:MAG: non-ribosomal peptide synthetase [Bacteroidales bacterium]|nr:non-ribosomal peptide synthetase [Bacteroidales bacterium]